MDFICTHDVVVCDLWGKVEGQFPELQRRGIKTAFDCADRPEDEASQVAMPHSDYLFFSSEAGDTVALRDQMKGYHSRGPKLVIAMLGEHGSLCYDGKEFHKFGIVPCDKVVDTMGAGDSYIAGFLLGITDGLTIDQAMEKGAANATETLKYFGAW
jgi:fructoselysine 6-kinase